MGWKQTKVEVKTIFSRVVYKARFNSHSSLSCFLSNLKESFELNSKKLYFTVNFVKVIVSYSQ